MTWLLNLLLPGTGLIIRRREWFGLFIALFFALCCNVAIAGLHIAPAAVPHWLSHVAVLLVAMTWLLAQIFLYRQGREEQRTAHALENILREIQLALDANNVELAGEAVESGLALNEESVELQVLRAQVAKRSGNERALHDACRRVRKLDRHKRYAAEIDAALHRDTYRPA